MVYTSVTSVLYITRDYGITYLFHDRRAKANMSLRLARSTAGSLPYKSRNLGIKISHGCREIAFCPVGYFNLSHPVYINPLVGTLKPQSNRPLYSNTAIGTLAVDGWTVTFGTARRGMGGLRPHPVPSSLYQI